MKWRPSNIALQTVAIWGSVRVFPVTTMMSFKLPREKYSIMIFKSRNRWHSNDTESQKRERKITVSGYTDTGISHLLRPAVEQNTDEICVPIANPDVDSCRSSER